MAEHRLVVRPEDDDTGLSCVGVCSCGRSFLGTSEERIEDVRYAFAMHVFSAKAWLQSERPRNKQGVVMTPPERRRIPIESRSLRADPDRDLLISRLWADRDLTLQDIATEVGMTRRGAAAAVTRLELPLRRPSRKLTGKAEQ